MKVLFYLCACIASSIAGIIGYPIAYNGDFGYPGVVGPPIPTYSTVVRPLGFPYSGFHGHPFTLTPSYVSYNLLPGNVVFSSVPVIPYLPVQPAGGKGKPGKKKPDEKKDDKGTKEETTEETAKGEEEETKENGEAEELNE